MTVAWLESRGLLTSPRIDDIKLKVAVDVNALKQTLLVTPLLNTDIQGVSVAPQVKPQVNRIEVSVSSITDVRAQAKSFGPNDSAVCVIPTKDVGASRLLSLRESRIFWERKESRF